jgi:sugar phosphate isomerase/epimerase
MEEDPLLMKELCQQSDVRVSSFSAHSPLMKPEAAVPRLTRAIQFADDNEAKFINTDEMLKPEWMTDELAHQAMHYSLRKSSFVAERHKVFICIEPHGIYTKTAAGLLKIVNLVAPQKLLDGIGMCVYLSYRRHPPEFGRPFRANPFIYRSQA